MAVGAIEIFNNVLGSSVDDFQYVLKALKERESFSASNEGDISSHINTLLGQSVTRAKGLLLLSSCMDGFSEQHLLDKVSAYTPLCIGALKSPADQPLGYSVIKQLLERFDGFHELEKNSIVSYIPDLVLSLPRCCEEARPGALRMLETLLTKYSKACGSQKNPIERFLVPLLDVRDRHLVMYVAKCIHLLQQVRGGGEQGTNHKLAWSAQYNLILQCIVKTFSALYRVDHSASEENSDKVQSSNVGPIQLCLEDLQRLTELTETTLQCNPVTLRALRLSTRLENLFVFLQAMIVEPFPVTKKLNCKHLLDILMKCLSAACGTPCTSHTEPMLHRCILDTLRALCVALKSDILPYYSLMIRMTLQSLDWSRTEEKDTLQPYAGVRRSAYRTLVSILRVVHSCKPPLQRGDFNIEDALIENILRDVCPKRNVVQLTMLNLSGSKQMQNKKEKRRHAMAVNAHGIPENVGQPTKRSDWKRNNPEVRKEALRCLQSVYACMGIFLKPNSHKLASETVVSLLYDHETPPEVKRELCPLLSTIVHCSPPSPSILPHSLQLYSLMQASHSTELSWLSQEGVTSHIASLRGVAPPLHFPSAPTTTGTHPQHSDSALREHITNGRDVVNQNNSLTVSSDKDDVIEVGVIDSSTDDSQDATDSQNGANKKRKRSADVTMDAQKISSNISISVPNGKKSKFTEDSVEISDDSNDETLANVVIPETQCNGSKNSENLKSSDVEKTSEVQVDKPADNVPETNPILDGGESPENIRLVVEDCDETCLDKTVDDEKSKPSVEDPVQGDKKKDLSVEEMMDAFVDDVNEEML